MKSIPKEFQKNKFFYLMEVNYTPTTPFKYHIINLNSLMFVPKRLYTAKNYFNSTTSKG